MCYKNILHAKFHSSNLIIEEFGNVLVTHIKFMKVSLTKNIRKLFFYMTFIQYSSKEIVCKLIVNFAGYFFKKGEKNYFLLSKSFEHLLPANLNFSRISEHFPIFRMQSSVTEQVDCSGVKLFHHFYCNCQDLS